jgi:hypothetical protein
MPPDNSAWHPTTAPLPRPASYTTPTVRGDLLRQRDDAFFADIGSIFDLGQLRPFLPEYKADDPARAQDGRDFFAATNTPRPSRCRSRPLRPEPVIGVWSTATARRCACSTRTTAPTGQPRPLRAGHAAGNPWSTIVIPLASRTLQHASAAQDAAALSQPGRRRRTIPLVQDPSCRPHHDSTASDTPPAAGNDLVPNLPDRHQGREPAAERAGRLSAAP